MKKITHTLKRLHQQHRYRKAIKREHARQIAHTPSAYDEAILSWEAPEYYEHQRGTVWKIMAISTIVLSAGIGFYIGAWSFSLAILAFALAYYLTHRKEPRRVEIKISEIGIKIGHKRYPYNAIKAFWIHYDPPMVKVLYIRVASEWIVDIPIQLEHEHPALIREILIEKIPEFEGRHVSVLEHYIRLFKL